MTNAQSASTPLYEMIYAVLREHIASGRFPRGLVLGEANVARAFKASRVPASALSLADSIVWPSRRAESSRNCTALRRL